MADPPDAIDTEALAAQVVEELDPGSVIDDKVVLSRRQLLALTGGGAGLAALGFGTGQASAADGTNDTSVGDVGAAGDSVDVYVDELRDDGGDEWLDVDDTGQINAGFGRTWAYDTLKTDTSVINQAHRLNRLDVTVSSGSISYQAPFMEVNGEGGANDDLTDITNQSEGDIVVLQAGDATITAIDGDGNLRLGGGTNKTLSSSDKLGLICRNGVLWDQLFYHSR